MTYVELCMRKLPLAARLAGHLSWQVTSTLDSKAVITVKSHLETNIHDWMPDGLPKTHFLALGEHGWPSSHS